MPANWSSACISAIYKKGNKSILVNYRLVSLTCNLCKIMEYVVCSQIGRHLDKQNILYQHPHGFLKQLPRETEIINSIDDWAHSISMKYQTDAIILDFSKAFTKLFHTKLLHKIRYYGITDHTNNWIRAFLGNCSQQVVVNCQTSSSAMVMSGVPQGTVLGPVLFLLLLFVLHCRR